MGASMPLCSTILTSFMHFAICNVCICMEITNQLASPLCNLHTFHAKKGTTKW
jgi:hypothetical protein